jgi:prepilin-type N-terminal cleavage/methylation domain-containing protein
MSNTFTKTSLRGFTLIELLVVIAIIGLLSTAIMGPVQTGLKKGRDTRKISDLTQVQGALIQFAGDNNGQYPAALTLLDPTYMKADAKMTTSSAARDRMMYTLYSDAAGNIVSYHLGTALENQNASLQGDADCGFRSIAPAPAAAISGIPAGDWFTIDTSAFLTQTTVGVAPNPLNNATSTCGDIPGGFLTNTNFSAGGAGNPAVSASTTDFGGAGSQEGTAGVCSSLLATCIFDVVPK